MDYLETYRGTTKHAEDIKFPEFGDVEKHSLTLAGRRVVGGKSFPGRDLARQFCYSAKPLCYRRITNALQFNLRGQGRARSSRADELRKQITSARW